MRWKPWLTLLVCSTLAHPQDFTPPAKESFLYNVEWRLFTAGKARLDWNAGPEPRKGFQVKLHLESVGLVSKLFRVEDNYSAELNQALCVQSSQMTSNEGKPAARHQGHVRRRDQTRQLPGARPREKRRRSQ